MGSAGRTCPFCWLSDVSSSPADETWARLPILLVRTTMCTVLPALDSRRALDSASSPSIPRTARNAPLPCVVRA